MREPTAREFRPKNNQKLFVIYSRKVLLTLLFLFPSPLVRAFRLSPSAKFIVGAKFPAKVSLFYPIVIIHV